jgi:hypothetical protein
LLQIFLVAALDIKTRDVNSLLSQYCKASHLFLLQIFMWGAPTVRFAPVVPWARPALAGDIAFPSSQVLF